MAAKPIKIAIVANARQAISEVEGFSGRLKRTMGKVGKWGAVGAAAVGAAAVKVGTDLASAASDAEQSLGATQTVFGKYADKVIENSERAARTIGLSANEYRELSNVTGALLDGAGVPMEKLAGLTDDLNNRAADMAATFGGTTAEAVEAISSLMKGAGDPVEKYGVSIRQSDVNARLAAKGQDKLTGAQRKEAEMLARVDLLMESTSKTQGQFARESDTLAGQQQRLKAQFDNIKAALGKHLLPILTTVFEWINDKAVPYAKDLAGALRDRLAPYVDKAKDAFKELVDRLKPLGDWLKRNPDLIKGAGIALGIAAGATALFAGAMALLMAVTSPITLVVLAIAAIGGALYYAYQNSETFRSALSTIGDAASAVFGWLRDNVGPIISSMVDLFKAQFDRIKAIVERVLDLIKRVWERHGDTILTFVTNTFDNIKNVVEGVMKVVRGIIDTVTSLIKGDWKGVWNGIKTILSGAWKAIKGVVKQGIDTAKTVLKVGWDAAKDLTRRAWDALKTAASNGVSRLMDKVREIPGKVKDVFSDAKEWLKEAGKDIVRGLAAGLDSMWDWVKSKIDKLTDKIPGWVKKKLGIKSPSRVMRKLARWIPAGIAKGIGDGEKGVQKALDRITKRIEKSITGKNEQKREKRVLKSLRDEYRAILKNAKAHDKVTKKIKDARQALKAARQVAADYARDIKDSFISFGSVLDLGETEDGTVTISGLLGDLRSRVNDAKRFNTLMQQLADSGLNQTTVQQMLAAGPAAALSTAEAIAYGGQAAVAEINTLTAELGSTGQQLGKVMADEFYGAGIASAQGLLNGLLKDQKAIEKTGKKLAKKLTKAVKKALGIKSPSRVFTQIGADVTEGLVIGLDEHRAKKAGQALSDGLTRGFGETTLDAAVRARAEQRSSVAVTLTAEQVSALERGRSVQMDLDAYHAAGGRRRAS